LRIKICTDSFNAVGWYLGFLKEDLITLFFHEFTHTCGVCSDNIVTSLQTACRPWVGTNLFGGEYNKDYPGKKEN
jgi:hypothetical protein